ncbi:hypothetical protein LZ24_01990 [Desulfobotulus alkaliphilus]|uniref:Uncharacterized protein n=1 Tax=Desulfobotulus alkaliphilus TaxID=622671 RepID=A0A562RQ83_9BACT|nr:hypothetical protein [Desulfobotulus alkaliphilus]TWI71192.1 hypothetical protein LZ24_01990 [Desulfobotulus alkaliphilus]
MAKVFRPSNRESKILSRIESSKERERGQALHMVRNHADMLSNTVSMKLVENEIIETTNKNGLQAQIAQGLEKLGKMEDFDLDFKIAPYRQVVANPNVVSLYLTAFVIEDLIKNKDVVDVYGSDEDIYHCIHPQVERFMALEKA